jgi:hypothetical protein
LLKYIGDSQARAKSSGPSRRTGRSPIPYPHGRVPSKSRGPSQVKRPVGQSRRTQSNHDAKGHSLSIVVATVVTSAFTRRPAPDMRMEPSGRTFCSLIFTQKYTVLPIQLLGPTN